MRISMGATLAIAVLLAALCGCGGGTDDTGLVLTPAEMASGAAEAATVYWWAALAAEPAIGVDGAAVVTRQATEEWAEAWLKAAYESAFGGTASVDVTTLTSSAIAYSVALLSGSAAGGQLALSFSLSVNATYTLDTGGDALLIGAADVTFTSLVVGMTTITGTLSAEKTSGTDDLAITCNLTAARGERTVSFQGSGTGSGEGATTLFTGNFVAVTINNSHRTFDTAVAQLTMVDGSPYPTQGGLSFTETAGLHTVTLATSGETTTATMTGPAGGASDVALPPLG